LEITTRLGPNAGSHTNIKATKIPPKEIEKDNRSQTTRGKTQRKKKEKEKVNKAETEVYL
jgi:hypothetical protein